MIFNLFYNSGVVTPSTRCKQQDCNASWTCDVTNVDVLTTTLQLLVDKDGARIERHGCNNGNAVIFETPMSDNCKAGAIQFT